MLATRNDIKHIINLSTVTKANMFEMFMNIHKTDISVNHAIDGGSIDQYVAIVDTFHGLRALPTTYTDDHLYTCSSFNCVSPVSYILLYLYFFKYYHTYVRFHFTNPLVFFLVYKALLINSIPIASITLFYFVLDVLLKKRVGMQYSFACRCLKWGKYFRSW